MITDGQYQEAIDKKLEFENDYWNSVKNKPDLKEADNINHLLTCNDCILDFNEKYRFIDESVSRCPRCFSDDIEINDDPFS